jgi:hypothetical protein
MAVPLCTNSPVYLYVAIAEVQLRAGIHLHHINPRNHPGRNPNFAGNGIIPALSHAGQARPIIEARAPAALPAIAAALSGGGVLDRHLRRPLYTA